MRYALSWAILIRKGDGTAGRAMDENHGFPVNERPPQWVSGHDQES